MKEQKKQNLADPNVRKKFVTYKEATANDNNGFFKDTRRLTSPT